MTDVAQATDLITQIQGHRDVVSLTWSPESQTWRVYMPLIARLEVARYGKHLAQELAVCYAVDPRQAYDELRRRLQVAVLQASYEDLAP